MKLNNSRLHCPSARTKVGATPAALAAAVAAFHGTMPFVQALIQVRPVARAPGWGIGNLTSIWPRFLIAAAFAAALSGCGGSKVMLQNPSIPKPLIDQLQLSVAARYPTAFDNFVHEEQVIGKEKWTIDLGRSNRLLFTQLFGSMFSEFQVIDDKDDARDLPIDALIEPSIDAFEFSVPSQSQKDEFAVWIRYRIKIFDHEGVQVANWPIAAYGKSQATTFGGDEALRRAAVLAMRDAAALIILQMDKSTGISKLRDTSVRRIEPPPAAIPEDGGLQLTAAEDSPDDNG